MAAPATRPSSSVALLLVESVGGSLKQIIGGAVLFVPGVIGFMHELSHGYDCDEPLHKSDFTIFAALMVAGALVVTPQFGKTLTNIFVTVSPYIPMLGGKRAGDIPAPQQDPSSGEPK